MTQKPLILKLVFLFVISLFGFVACTQKPSDTFQLSGSPLEYKTKAFEDTKVLAEVAGQIFTRDQILDKSPVLKDIERQEQVVSFALLLERFVETTPSATVVTARFFTQDKSITAQDVLNVLGGQNNTGLKIEFLEPSDQSTLATFTTQASTPKSFRKEDVNQNDFRFQSLQAKRYEETAQQLNSQVSRIFAAQAAEKKGISLQEFIEKEILRQPIRISDEELKKYFIERGITESDLKPDQIENIRRALGDKKSQTEIEKWLAESLKGQPLLVSFTEPTARLELDTNFTPVAGYKTAPVSVVVFSSATCAECSKSAQLLRDISQDYDGSIKANWIHSVDITKGFDLLLAQAALCAEKQKKGSTVSLFSEVQINPLNSDEQLIYDWAQNKGLDSEKLKTCVVQGEEMALLEKHMAYSKSTGIALNPTVWVNGQLFSGFIDQTQIRAAIENEVKASGENFFTRLMRKIKSRFSRE